MILGWLLGAFWLRKSMKNGIDFGSYFRRSFGSPAFRIKGGSPPHVQFFAATGGNQEGGRDLTRLEDPRGVGEYIRMYLVIYDIFIIISE